MSCLVSFLLLRIRTYIAFLDQEWQAIFHPDPDHLFCLSAQQFPHSRSQCHLHLYSDSHPQFFILILILLFCLSAQQFLHSRSECHLHLHYDSHPQSFTLILIFFPGLVSQLRLLLTHILVSGLAPLFEL